MIDFENTRSEGKVATVKIMSRHKLPHCNFFKVDYDIGLLQYRREAQVWILF